MVSDTPKILELDTVFSSLNYKGLVHDNFRTTTSFLDYDAVLIDTGLLSHRYGVGYPATYNGKRLISENDSHRMTEEFACTKAQIIELLKQGKNVFILMARNENCVIHTGEREYSGTGKMHEQQILLRSLMFFPFCQ